MSGTVDETTTRSRRSVLAATVAALGGAIAQVLSRAEPAAAANGDPVLVSATTTGTGITKVSSNVGGSSVSAALVGESTGNGETYGVDGIISSSPGAGVRGQGPGVGVRGIAAGTSGVGVYATGGGTGVFAEGTQPEARGVVAMATDKSDTPNFGLYAATGSPRGTAVFGFSGDAQIDGWSYPQMRVGVAGWASLDASSRGVWGHAAAGSGVRGDATTGVGVTGEATAGVGVRAIATTGVALQVTGRLVLSRSGKASIPKNSAFVDVAIPGGLASNATVWALLQTARPGVWVRAVAPNTPTPGKARILLNKVASTTSSTTVAWAVLG